MSEALQAQAAELQRLFVEERRKWIDDPENGLVPWPRRRTNKRKPEPGLYEVEDPELG